MASELCLHSIWEEHGAQWMESRGYHYPKSFNDIELELSSFREGAALQDVSYRGKVKVTGSDRVSVLHNILTQDIQGISEGEGREAAFLSRQGKVLSYMTVYRFHDSFLLDLELGESSKTIAYLEKFIITEDVTLEDATGSIVHLYLEGPQTSSLIENLKNKGVNAELIPLSEIRANIFLETKVARETINEIISLGNKHGLQLVGELAAEIHRIENGRLRFGIDIDEEIILSETGLETVSVSETKGCYPGQEVIARIATYDGLRRKAFKFTAEGDKPFPPQSKIRVNDKEVGWLTSSIFSGTKNKIVSLGYLSREYFEGGNPLEVSYPGGKRPLKAYALGEKLT